MRSRLKVWTAAAALVLVAGGSLAACGDKDGAAGAESGPALEQAAFFDKVTQAQLDAGTSHLSMSVGVAGQKLTAEGDLKVGKTADDTAMALMMETGQSGMGSLEMRLVDQVFYLNFGPMTNNKFTTIDLSDPSNPIAKQYTDIIGNLDPAQQLKQLEGAVTSFEQKGKTAKLDGVQTRPYVITIDTAKIAGVTGSQRGEMPKTLEYTMFVGADDLPRRFITTLPDLGGSGGGTMTIDYSKWGEKVDIAKPPASEITDENLLDQFGGAASTS